MYDIFILTNWGSVPTEHFYSDQLGVRTHRTFLFRPIGGPYPQNIPIQTTGGLYPYFLPPYILLLLLLVKLLSQGGGSPACL